MRRWRGKLRSVRILSWNLFHGRSQPQAGRDLLPEFGAALASWAWDVALLQEVPPWWPPLLGDRCQAHARTALTSRNLVLPARRALAERWPDVIKSNGGGANAILVRAAFAAPPRTHRKVTLRLWPERRVAHGVELADHGLWVANLHAQVHSDARACADLAKAAATFADAPRLVLGGDTNVRRPRADGLAVIGGHDVDFVLARGLHGTVQALRSGRLSDHRPVRADLS